MFSESHVPLSMKEVIVRPVLKKSSLDVDTLSSYRPVSNLTQVSKCLGKVIAQQLIGHTSDMTELYQSTYKSNHSTETALIAVCNDMKRAFDNRKGTALVMIDLSAAFNTITFTSENQKQIWYISQCIKMVSVLSSRKMPTCINI